MFLRFNPFHSSRSSRISRGRTAFVLCVLFVVALQLFVQLRDKQSLSEVGLGQRISSDVKNSKGGAGGEYDNIMDGVKEVVKEIVKTSAVTKSDKIVIKPDNGQKDKGKESPFKGLTDLELQEALAALHTVKAREPTRNVLFGTPLDNDAHTNSHEAPLPREYEGKMTHTYKPYEQVRIVKEKAGNSNREVHSTFLTLVRNSELAGILSSIYQVEQRFNHNKNYDWVFLNDEPFSEEFVWRTSKMVSGTARYGIIPPEHWSYPEWIDQDRARAARESFELTNVPYGGSESYRHMCRYNSKFFYHHPILEDYELYWRVEPDVEFACDILEDPFQYMARTQTQYGFTIPMVEFSATVETLWPTSKEFFAKEEVAEQLPSMNENLVGFVSDPTLYNYNLCHFWTNFEIANLSLWHSPLYEAYVDHLDRAGGFFYERWGDAPVHSIAVALMLRKNQVHQFTDIAYRHTVAGTCPLDDTLYERAHCTCSQVDDFTLTQTKWCDARYKKASGQKGLQDMGKYEGILVEKARAEKALRVEEMKIRNEMARRKAGASLK